MDGILRHIGRKYNMYGEGLDDMARVDTVLGGVESLRSVYIGLIFQVCVRIPLARMS